MDLNIVELRGKVYSDITIRKSRQKADWVTFTVMTKELTKGDALSSIKPTFSNICVFESELVKRVVSMRVKQGDLIWLRGKLFTKAGKGGIIYTSVLVVDFEILKTPRDVEKEEENNEDNL